MFVTILRWKRILKKYLITYPTVVCCLVLSIWIYFIYHRIQISTNQNYSSNDDASIDIKLIRMIPSIVYSILIILMNFIYKKIAIILTNFGR